MESEVVVAGLAERVVGSVLRQPWCEVVVRMVVDVGSMSSGLQTDAVVGHCRLVPGPCWVVSTATIRGSGAGDDAPKTGRD